ncbi:MAG TPA: ABC transporter permease [Solirubrobacteraceae bacterium]|jgi:phospholipid/cholesterol/gamma-HCH transport system permease protein|nr:ABC transporter permease [Solirubrobacteraceae bacterium]
MSARVGTQVGSRTARRPRATAESSSAGGGAFGWLDEFAGMMILTGQTFVMTFKPPYSWFPEFLEQSWLVTKRAFLPCMFCTLVFSWGAPGISGGSIVATLGTPDRLGSFSIMASVRELSTWINGMCVAGIAGTAICADLGARKIREELDALAVLGTDLVKTLIVPRFLALGLMTVIFNYWNTAISIIGQMFADMMVWHQTAAGFIMTFASNFSIAEIAFNFLKVLSFGFIVAIVCCYKGMNARGGAAGVGRAVNQAVVIAFCLIYVYNYLINAILLAAFPETAQLH